jgi:hypothetical protein
LTFRYNTAYNAITGRARLEANPVLLELQSAIQAVSPVSSHNALSGLQGGTVGEYFHLTNAQYNDYIGKTEVVGISGNLQMGISEITGSPYVLDSRYVVGTTSTNNKRTIFLRASVDSRIIPTGAKKILIASPIAGVISQWRLISDIPTIASVDIWKANGVLPTISNTIIGSNPPNLSSATVASSGVSTWTTSVAVGDIFELSVSSNSAATVLNCEIEMDIN